MAIANCTSFCCDICGIDMSTPFSYIVHRESLEHKLLKLITSKCASTTRKGPKNINTRNFQVNTLKCRVCDIYVSGVVSFKEHIRGRNHGKKMLMIKRMAVSYLSQRDVSSIRSTPDKKELVSRDDVPKSKPSECEASNRKRDFNFVFPFYCEFCKKFFSGDIPHQQHLRSAAHIKKVENATCDNNVAKYTCCVCGALFSGSIPYKQHISSAKHVKKDRIKQYRDIIVSDSRDIIKIEKEEKSENVATSSTGSTSDDDDDVHVLPSDIRVIRADEPVNFFKL